MKENLDYQTTRIWKVTLKKLRILHALLDQSIVEILERLVSAELERVNKESNND